LWGYLHRVLTQSSTKVYQNRNGVSVDLNLHARIEDQGYLRLWPQPTTCFKDAVYSQRQEFHLESSQSSLLLLDWMTAGRVTRKEVWSFERFLSRNIVYLGSQTILNDAWLLNGESLPQKMAPYTCYATVILIGPATAGVRESLMKLSRKDIPFSAYDFLFSLSPLPKLNAQGSMLRLASRSTEMISDFMSQHILQC
jgi:urease accessory protein